MTLKELNPSPQGFGWVAAAAYFIGGGRLLDPDVAVGWSDHHVDVIDIFCFLGFVPIDDSMLRVTFKFLSLLASALAAARAKPAQN